MLRVFYIYFTGCRWSPIRISHTDPLCCGTACNYLYHWWNGRHTWEDESRQQSPGRWWGWRPFKDVQDQEKTWKFDTDNGRQINIGMGCLVFTLPLSFLAHLSTKCEVSFCDQLSSLSSLRMSVNNFLQMTSPTKPMDWFQNNFTRMFLKLSFFKVVQKN